MDQALVSLLSASIAFVGTHFALSHPLRAPLVRALGPSGFMAVYSLVAFATFIWAGLAFRAVGPGGTPLWDGMGDIPWIVATVVMLLASVLFAGSFARNPALPDPRAAQFAVQDPHGVFHVTRHPMMWGFALWAGTHILVSPVPRQIVLAGALGLLALLGAKLQDRKKEALMGDAWARWESSTSFVPRTGQLGKAGTTAWIGGIAIWLGATFGHIHANGIPAGIWRWVG
ncbi:NnrU family protein [Qipengyuania sp. 6B39]|uniref:NnrU family protein n=1 Tax=Qipengyuania proteolytica TaxID=2867239 RepID=UPI001C8A58F0|nr:NnrU family protein [Qipengyuania proteolytica]MBX7494727.1 NnrU family protein [Qipengyuania proteolytica]